MNKLLAVVCAAMFGSGGVLVIASYLAAQIQGGWQPEAEDPERSVMPLEWVAFGGVSLMLLAPLLYAAARTDDLANHRL
jgi:hypothetical protein